MDKVAPMLQKLGYDPFGNPPNYGEPEKAVKENTDDIQKNHNFWENKAHEVKGDISRRTLQHEADNLHVGQTGGDKRKGDAGFKRRRRQLNN